MVAVTLFTSLGNTQDDAAAVPTGGVSSEGVAMGYAAQGNVAMSKAQHEADLQRAALAARQEKALKAAMASYAQTPPPITTAEQFLAVNRPPAGPPREGDFALSPVKTSTYVPEFQTPSGSVNSSGVAPQTTTASPGRKPGLFDLFKSKKSSPTAVDTGTNPYTAEALAPPAASDEQPSVAAAPVTGGEAPMVDQSEAIAAATVFPAPTEAKPDFFGRLFGKGKKAEPAVAVAPAPDSVGTVTGAPAEPSATVAAATEATGIPTPPAFTDGATPPPAASPGAASEN